MARERGRSNKPSSSLPIKSHSTPQLPEFSSLVNSNPSSPRSREPSPGPAGISSRPQQHPKPKPTFRELQLEAQLRETKRSLRRKTEECDSAKSLLLEVNALVSSLRKGMNTVPSSASDSLLPLMIRSNAAFSPPSAPVTVALPSCGVLSDSGDRPTWSPSSRGRRGGTGGGGGDERSLGASGERSLSASGERPPGADANVPDLSDAPPCSSSAALDAGRCPCMSESVHVACGGPVFLSYPPLFFCVLTVVLLCMCVNARVWERLCLMVICVLSIFLACVDCTTYIVNLSFSLFSH
jgi:hypothetical protein